MANSFRLRPNCQGTAPKEFGSCDSVIRRFQEFLRGFHKLPVRKFAPWKAQDNVPVFFRVGMSKIQNDVYKMRGVFAIRNYLLALLPLGTFGGFRENLPAMPIPEEWILFQIHHRT